MLYPAELRVLTDFRAACSAIIKPAGSESRAIFSDAALASPMEGFDSFYFWSGLKFWGYLKAKLTVIGFHQSGTPVSVSIWRPKASSAGGSMR